MTLTEWATRWGIPPNCLIELQGVFGIHESGLPPIDIERSEAAIQNLVKAEASRKGARLWRNNRGAATTESGSFIRFGLANESASLDKKIKSADLIGIRPIKITAAHVGATIGQFISREIKASNWRFSEKNEREVAQLKWAQLIVSLGGDACFATGEGTL